MNHLYSSNSIETELNNMVNIVKDIFWDDLDFLGYFGSRATWTHTQYSDIDFIVLLKNHTNQTEREKFSPLLKQKLTTSWIKQLSAFNIYNTEEFLSAPHWFQAVLSKNIKIIHDTIWLQEQYSTLYKQTTINEKSWLWESNNHKDIIDRCEFLIQKLETYQCLTIDTDIAKYYALEVEKIKKIQQSLKSWLFSTVSSFEDIAKYFNESSLLNARRKDMELHVLEEKIFFDYSFSDKHFEASAQISTFDKIWQLKHLLSACHIMMREILHQEDYFIIDGEVTQAFFKFCEKLPEYDIGHEDFFHLIKAEQIIGRSGLLSFDLTNEWVLFAEKTDEQLLIELTFAIKKIYKKLRYSNTINTKTQNPVVSIIIPSYNRFNYLKDSFNYINDLVFPDNKVEIIIVDDWSDVQYIEEKLYSKFPMKVIRKEHSWITDTRNVWINNAQWEFVVFLDDDIKVSPLTLLRLFAKWQNDNTGIVGVSVKWIPEEWFIPEYIHYRGLLSWPIRDSQNEIVNVPACCILTRKRILEILWWFSKEQSKQWITFWWEDVDITYKMKKQGFEITYNPKAIVYHKHRSSLKDLIKQHIWYGEWTAFHCIEQWRNFEELWIPQPTYTAVSKDVFSYILHEVPKRIYQLHKEWKNISKTLWYPLLDLIRRISYDIWVLLTKKLYTKK